MSQAHFTPAQYERYKRHLSLPEVGPDGQRALLEASVLLVGAGGLGSPLALYLAAAGVGRIGIVDHDRVDASNLQRQVLYSTRDVGRPKVEVARERLEALNPDVRVEPHDVELGLDNALDLLRGYDLVVDGSDNFPTRYLVNDACVLLGRPNVYGSVLRFEGQATVFDPPDGPCYRCLFPEPPPPGLVPSCSEGGVLGVLPGLVAMVQATETLKRLLGAGESLSGRLLALDGLEMRWREFRIRPDPKCPACGEAPTIRELIDYEGFCGIPQPGGVAMGFEEKSATEIADMRKRGESFLLLDVRNLDEFEKARIEGATLIPLPELEGRLGELDDWKQRPVVVHCRKGPRGVAACELLAAQGFEQLTHMAGGIEAWSLTVDPGVPLY